MIINKPFLVIFATVSLLLVATSYAENLPCPAEGCAPCGYSAANAANIPTLPSDVCGVNPITNYTATYESCRNRGFFSGLYVGAAYGIGATNYDLEIAGKSPLWLEGKTRSYSVAIFDAGLNLVLDYFFLGLEAGYNIRSPNNLTSYYNPVDFLNTQAFSGEGFLAAALSFPCQVHIDINSYHAATADILPGFVYSRFVAYLRLGVERANYFFDERVCFPAIFLDLTENTAVIEGQDFTASFKTSKTGYRLGAGFGIAASEHVSFHLNYIHTFTEKTTYNFDVGPIAVIAPVITGAATTVTAVSLVQLAAPTTIEPQKNEVNFGVKFRF